MESHVSDNYRRRLLGINRSLQYDASLQTIERYIQSILHIERHILMLEDGADDLLVLLATVKTSALASRRMFENQETPDFGSANTNKHLKIDREKLEFLIKEGFSITCIAKNGLLGKKLHRNTVSNAIKRFNIKNGRKKYTTLDDEQLKQIMFRYKNNFPNSGAIEMQSHLQQEGIILQRDRCRRLLRVIDPDGVASRWAQTIARRQYSVPTANCIWHIDTNHKLIR